MNGSNWDAKNIPDQSGRVIVVTGASSGIGKATAIELIKKGHKVYGLARRIEKMQDIPDHGGNVIKMDVTNHEQVKEVIDSIIEKEGRIDVLVNNAGYSIYGPIEDTSYEMAKQQFEVNLFGLAEVINEAINSDDPETRYPVGNMAKENIAARESMSDKYYDTMVMEHLEAAGNLK